MNDRAEVGSAPIELSHEAPFVLGAMEVRPATLELVHDGRRLTVEHRVMQILVALARKRGQVLSREELMVAGWGELVVGEDALHRCVARLRRLAEASGAFTLENIPRVGYRLQEAAPPTAAASPTRASHRIVWLGLGASAVLAVAAGVAWRHAHPPAAAELLVAVRSFDATGDDPALKALAEAVTNETLTETTREVPTLPPDVEPRGAAVSVGGQVSRSGEGFKATVYINDVRTLATLWSGQVTAPADDLPARAAVRVSEKLRCGLAAYQPGLRLDAESRALYFDVCETTSDTASQMAATQAAARRLVARAPRFPEAHGMLAMIDSRMAESLAPGESGAVRAEARRHAKRALELDPKQPLAYLTLGMTNPWSDWAGTEAWLRKGLAVAPDHPYLHARLGKVLSNVGRIEEARSHWLRVAQLAPAQPRTVPFEAQNARLTGRVAEAQAIEARAERLWGRQHPTVQSARLAAALEDDPTAALEILDDPAQRLPSLTDAQIDALRRFASFQSGAGGTRDEAVRALVAALDAGQFPIPEEAERYVWALLVLNEKAAAVRAVDRLAATPQGASLQLLYSPAGTALRQDPAFWSLAARLGLVDYWRKSGHWPDFCADPGSGVDCKAMAKTIPAAQVR